jgi:osmoprotectant transport system substrate-binding protein
MAAILLAVALGCIAGGCGANSTPNSAVTLTVASKDAAEEVILGEIYAQALEAAGYKVKRHLRLPSGLPPFEREGLRISGYPEHLNIALKDILRIKEDVPGDPMEAYELAKERLEERGLTAFSPTSFSRSKAVGLLRKTAEERDLKTLSGLSEEAGEMTIAAGLSCSSFLDCLGGLERFYGIAFELFLSTEPVSRYKVLETGAADASILLSTEGRLAGRRSEFVILEDDKHRLPAGNAFWVTTPEVVDEAGPDYEKAIVGAQTGLTLKVMQELDAKVKLEKEPVAKVAAEYLKSIGVGDNSTAEAAAPKCKDVKPAKARSVSFGGPKQTVRRREKLTAVVSTSCGTFSIALDARRFPTTVNTFVFLARKGFYEGVPFDRAGGGRFLEGGNPPGNADGPGYSVSGEVPSSFIYRHGVVAMSQSGEAPPGHAGSQFFIVLAHPWLDIGGAYAPLGTVEDGFDVLNRISELGPSAEGSSNLGVVGPIGKLRRPVLIEKISIQKG